MAGSRNAFQARTGFEDSLAREYGELARGIPVVARLGSELTDSEFDESFPRLVQYFDLCNEQIFLRMTGRVSRSTWEQWREGIKAHLQQPAFARIWRTSDETAGERYLELRRLDATRFSDDPRAWVSHSTKLLQFVCGVRQRLPGPGRRREKTQYLGGGAVP